MELESSHRVMVEVLDAYISAFHIDVIDQVVDQDVQRLVVEADDYFGPYGVAELAVKLIERGAEPDQAPLLAKLASVCAQLRRLEDPET
jgi:chromosome condensin MukBEF complex kleisin-like MukF subunit